jgi:hypothetical protein
MSVTKKISYLYEYHQKDGTTRLSLLTGHAACLFLEGKIADFILKLSRLAQFHLLTVKMSKSILEPSKQAQFRPSQSARATILPLFSPSP